MQKTFISVLFLITVVTTYCSYYIVSLRTALSEVIKTEYLSKVNEDNFFYSSNIVDYFLLCSAENINTVTLNKSNLNEVFYFSVDEAASRINKTYSEEIFNSCFISYLEKSKDKKEFSNNFELIKNIFNVTNSEEEVLYDIIEKYKNKGK